MTPMLRVSHQLVVLLWLGLGNSLVWVGLTAPAALAQSAASAAATARSVDRLDTRVDILDQQVDENRIETARVSEKMDMANRRIDDITRSVADIQRGMETLTWSALGFFVTTSCGLIAVLWSVRAGWLQRGDNG